MSEAADDVIDTAAPAPEAEAPDLNTEMEAAARAGGWRPKDEFEGDPDKWVDAPKYVLNAANILPQLTKDLKEAKSEIKGFKSTLREFADHHSKTEQRMYAKALEELQVDIDHAAAAGDVQGVRNATDKLVELTKEAEIPKPAKADAVDPDFQAWKDENAWFGTDEAMTGATVAIANAAEREGYSGKALIKETDRRVREKFPDKFENPNRRQASAVEGGGTTVRRTGKTYADLPADAKSACDDFVKRVPGFTREKYCKDFFA